VFLYPDRPFFYFLTGSSICGFVSGSSLFWYLDGSYVFYIWIVPL
jgi:hypothetical protein